MTGDASTETGRWDGGVPTAIDPRIVALVVVLAGLAASLNVPYGGIEFAAVAFCALTIVGICAHVLGQRRLQRITAGLADHWDEHGASVEAVSHADGWGRTSWVVSTSAGSITVTGLALAPLSKVSIEWQGTGDVLQASEAEDRLESLAAEWYQEVVEIPASA
ncbi:hypothetical protein [Halovivax gelatinilyticus]|uniref:hypothetical protein n=1 Tax=Halovivax gelatinilyticus TaxID=2961597 RepID=UPI0020CA5638|nr:hypothetical protein [Halovivax gelatinilyticus]